MKVKLYLDEDVYAQLAHALRQRGFDAVHAQELDQKGLTDLDQLRTAVRQKRCIFSFNVKDFVLLHNMFAEDNREHWGIIVSKQRSFGDSLNKLLRLLTQNTQESMMNRIYFL